MMGTQSYDDCKTKRVDYVVMPARQWNLRNIYAYVTKCNDRMEKFSEKLTNSKPKIFTMIIAIICCNLARWYMSCHRDPARCSSLSLADVLIMGQNCDDSNAFTVPKLLTWTRKILTVIGGILGDRMMEWKNQNVTLDDGWWNKMLFISKCILYVEIIFIDNKHRICSVNLL